MRRLLLGALVFLVSAPFFTGQAEAITFTIECNVAQLKQAIIDTNALPGPDAIALAPDCTYSLTTVDNTDPNYGSTALPVVTDELIILGNNATIERTDQAPSMRILWSSANLYAYNLLIRGGLAETDNTARGGGLFVQANFLGEFVGFQGNSAAADFAYGGGIFASGTLDCTSCSFLFNTALSTFGFAGGGGAYGLGGITMSNSVVAQNGAISSTGTTNGGGLGSQGTVSLTAVLVTQNAVSGAGGGGAGLSTLGTVTLTGVTLSDNEAILVGPGSGGGAQTNGNISVTRSSITGNEVTGGTQAQGGGTYAFGNTTIVESLYASNEATGTASAAEGGGAFSAKELHVTNSTFSSNRAAGIADTLVSAGGGTFSILATTITNATYYDNQVTGFSARGHAAGLVNGATISSSILVGTLSPQCWAFNPGETIAGEDTLVSDDSCSTASEVPFANIGLDSLGFNDGTTQTHALLNGSPAIGVGVNCPATDQRGYQRPATGCDSGSFEDGGIAPNSPFDVDCSGESDSTDVLAILNALAGISTGPQPTEPCSADVTQDQQVTLEDAVYLRQWLAGLIPN